MSHEQLHGSTQPRDHPYPGDVRHSRSAHQVTRFSELRSASSRPPTSSTTCIWQACSTSCTSLAFLTSCICQAFSTSCVCRALSASCVCQDESLAHLLNIVYLPGFLNTVCLSGVLNIVFCQDFSTCFVGLFQRHRVFVRRPPAQHRVFVRRSRSPHHITRCPDNQKAFAHDVEGHLQGYLAHIKLPTP